MAGADTSITPQKSGFNTIRLREGFNNNKNGKLLIEVRAGEEGDETASGTEATNTGDILLDPGHRLNS